MIYVIMNSDVLRNQPSQGWAANGALFTLTSALTGAAFGAALGAIAGAAMEESTRLGIATLLALLLTLVSVLELFNRAPRPLQCDRETSRRSLSKGSLHGAIMNGFHLGHGASTRIGFWLWFAIPAGAFLAGHAGQGAIMYGTYGMTRGLGPWLLVGVTAVHARWNSGTFADVARILLTRAPAIRRSMGAVGTVIGFTLLAVIGI